MNVTATEEAACDVVTTDGASEIRDYAPDVVAESWIRAKGLSSAGDPQRARHDSPFTLWFLRREEILVPMATGVD
jgi:hypothetical protein